MKRKLKSFISFAADNGKQVLKMFGFLNPILEVRTDDTLFPVGLDFKDKSEIPQIIENILNEFQEKNVKMYAWNQTMTGTNMETGAISRILVTIGELKEGDQGVLITPFTQKGGEIEYQKERWEDPQKYQNLFESFTGIFKKPDNVNLPLIFWKKEEFVYEFDLIDYTNVEIDYEQTSRFIDEQYWFLIKFLFILSQFTDLKSTHSNTTQIWGVPKNLKIKCECGNLLDDEYWIKGRFIPPKELAGRLDKHLYNLRISQKCNKCGKRIIIYRSKSGKPFTPLFYFINPSLLNSQDFNKAGLLFHWIVLFNLVLNMNISKMCRIFSKEINLLLKLVNNNKDIPEEIKLFIKSERGFEKFVKIDKTNKLKMQLSGSLVVLSDFIVNFISFMQENRISPETYQLFKSMEAIINAVGSYIYGTFKKEGLLSIVLSVSRNVFQMRDLPEISEFRKAILSECEDIVKLLSTTDLDEDNIPVKEIDNLLKQVSEKREIKGLLWRTGTIISIYYKEQLKNHTLIDLLSELLLYLGEFAYNDKSIKSITKNLKKFKQILQEQTKSSPSYERIITNTELVLEDIHQISKTYEE